MLNKEQYYRYSHRSDIVAWTSENISKKAGSMVFVHSADE